MVRACSSPLLLSPKTLILGNPRKWAEDTNSVSCSPIWKTDVKCVDLKRLYNQISLVRITRQASYTVWHTLTAKQKLSGLPAEHNLTSQTFPRMVQTHFRLSVCCRHTAVNKRMDAQNGVGSHSDVLFGRKKGSRLGAPGWLSWVSVQLLILAQVMISGSCDRALHQALH